MSRLNICSSLSVHFVVNFVKYSIHIFELFYSCFGFHFSMKLMSRSSFHYCYFDSDSGFDLISFWYTIKLNICSSLLLLLIFLAVKCIVLNGTECYMLVWSVRNGLSA